MVEIRKDAMYSDCLNQPCSIIKKKLSSCILVVQINYNKTQKVLSSQMMLISQLFWRRILVNSSLSSQKLLYVDGNSSDGEHVWAIGLRENSFSYLINVTSILGTVNKSDPVINFTSFPRSGSGSPRINLLK